MTERQDPEARLRDGLESLARDASDGAVWERNVEQHVSIARTVFLSSGENRRLHVTFDARKSVGTTARLSAYYRLEGRLVEDELAFEELPDAVAEQVLAEIGTMQHEESQTVELVQVSGVDEIDEDDEDESAVDTFDTDELRYRREQYTSYVVSDGEAVIEVSQGLTYNVLYGECPEEVFVDLVPHRSAIAARELPVMSLQLWGGGERSETDRQSLPDDLKVLEEEIEIDNLNQDIEYVEAVRSVALDPETEQQDRLERVQSIMTMIAFLRFQGRSDDILRLIQ
ncbi:hypothetical protein LRY29_00155 [Candidatus Saccharibacteria bacterium]|nr:hypothetical protein [Candidatus Saccharibacteria bacterium]